MKRKRSDKRSDLAIPASNPPPRPHLCSSSGRGFSLIELLVTMAVLSIFVLLLTTVTDSTFKLWRNTQTSVTMFGNARGAYDILARRLSQATLNTYLDYYDNTWTRRDPSSSTFTPSKYGRASDLHFVSGTTATVLAQPPATHPGHGVFFFAPLGYVDNDVNYADLPNLLNAVGYYIEFASDTTFRPSFLSPLDEKYRFRLVENILPSQDFNTAVGGFPAFTDTATANDLTWIRTGLAGNTSGKSPIADNIIALIVRPELPEADARSVFGSGGKAWNLTPNYAYDSRAGANRPAITTSDPTALHFAQLPPMLRVVMVAVDETAANRFTTGTTPPTVLTLNSTWFTDPSKLNDDLDALSSQLSAQKIPFRVFNQVIPLRGAKFSAQPEN